MVVGTFFKTGFERGLPAHEQVVKQLLPLMPKTRKAYWPYYFSAGEGAVLPTRAGAALNSRLRMPGKDRRLCIPTGSTPAVDLLQWKKAECKFVPDENLQIFVTAAPSEVLPLHSESVDAKWQENLEAINKGASAFNEAFEIQNESLSKEVLHRLVVPASLEEGRLFAYDGAFGSHCADDIKFTVVTHDPAAALFLKHMGNPVPQVDPVDFPNLFSVFHVHDYKFTDPKVVEEFAGVSPQQLGITSPRFILYNLAERTVFVSGSTQALQNAIVCMGGMVAFHLYGSLTMKCSTFLDTNGKLTVVFGEAPLDSPKLYGAHHAIWSRNGISRAWNGVTRTTSSTAKPQYTADLVETTAAGSRLTAPLPLQLGGRAGPRGTNLPVGATPGTPEPLIVDPKLGWRPNVVPTQGAKFVFIGPEPKAMLAEDAAQLFAETHVGYPTGFASKKALAACFKELAASSGASFSVAPNVTL